MTGRASSDPKPTPAPEEARDGTIVFLRPIGAPLTLGFFGLAGATFVLSGLQLGWIDPGEGNKVALALIGFTAYAAWAVELEDAQGRTVLPLGRRCKGKIAVRGDLADQVQHIPNEPGVRTQL